MIHHLRKFPVVQGPIAPGSIHRQKTSGYRAAQAATQAPTFFTQINVFMRRVFLLLVCMGSVVPGVVAAQTVSVVASFSILANLVEEVGGPHVRVQAVVGADQDAHVFQPRPSDIARLRDADLVVVNGLGFDPWMARMVEAAGSRAQLVDVSVGVPTLAASHAAHAHAHAHENRAHHPTISSDERTIRNDARVLNNVTMGEPTLQNPQEHMHTQVSAHGHGHGHAHDHDHDHDHHHGNDHASNGVQKGGAAPDPHIWQDPFNVMRMAANIAHALIALDPTNAANYESRRDTYVQRLHQLHQHIEAEIARVPVEDRTVITSHDAMAYYGQRYGFRFRGAQGITTASEPSAREVAQLVQRARSGDVRALFLQDVANRALLQQIAAESNAVIGGRLYNDALSGADGPASTYIKLMRHNTRMLVDALLVDCSKPCGSEQKR